MQNPDSLHTYIKHLHIDKKKEYAGTEGTLSLEILQKRKCGNFE